MAGVLVRGNPVPASGDDSGGIMRYEVATASVTFFLDNPRRENPAVSTLSFEGASLAPAQLRPLLDALVRHGQGKRLTSQRNALAHFLRPLLSFLKGQDVHWPSSSNAWQIFLLRFFQFYLADMTWSQASPSTRMSYWSTLVGGIFDFLVVEEVVPCDVVVPVINKKHIKSLAANQPMLGERHTEAASTQDSPQKLLVNVDFGKSDAEYLDSVEAGCKQRIAQIQEVCQTHWNTLISDIEMGRKLASQVTEADIEAVVASGQYRERVRGGTPAPVASPGHPKGHIWALAVIRHLLAAGQEQNCISTHTLRALPFFSKKALKERNYEALYDHTAMER